MAIIYTIDLVDYVLKNMTQINDDSMHHELFSITHKDEWQDTDLVTIKTKSAGSDIVHIKEKVVMEPHTHDDEEHRLIISGIGHFFIPFEKSIVIIKATEGDFVSLKRNTVHWFTCKKGLVAARFFENEKSYKAIMKNIPHEIYRLKDDFVDLSKIKI